MKRKPRNKRASCGHWHREEEELCDSCLLKKYDLQPCGRLQGRYSEVPVFSDIAVIKALRKAERMGGE